VAARLATLLRHAQDVTASDAWFLLEKKHPEDPAVFFDDPQNKTILVRLKPLVTGDPR
jgi:hypothetical protein